MVVKPEDLINLTSEQIQIANDIENIIDAQLLKAAAVPIIIHHEKFQLMDVKILMEIFKRYKSVGWDIVYNYRDGITTLVFKV